MNIHKEEATWNEYNNYIIISFWHKTLVLLSLDVLVVQASMIIIMGNGRKMKKTHNNLELLHTYEKNNDELFFLVEFCRLQFAAACSTLPLVLAFPLFIYLPIVEYRLLRVG